MFSLRKKSLAIMFFLSTLIIANVIVLYFFIDKQTADSTIINIAGRQRMLSQKMTKEILLMTMKKNVKLKETHDLFHNSLYMLLNGDEQGYIKPAQGIFKEKLVHVEQIWQDFSRQVKKIIASSNSEIHSSSQREEQIRQSIDYVISQNIELLNKMNIAVLAAEHTAQDKITNLKIIQIAISTLIVTCIVLIFYFGIAPLARELEHNIQILYDSAHEILDSTKQVMSMSKNVSTKTIEQSVGLEEITFTTIEMASLTAKVAQSAKLSAATYQEYLEKMSSVDQKFQSLQKEFTQVNKNFGKVQTINKNVRKIVANTKLLSINTAIEAAHKNNYEFGIIADEVKKLSVIADQLSENNHDIIHSTQENIEACQNTVYQTTKALQEMNEMVDKISSQIQGVSESNAIQVTSSQQIAVNTQKINDAVKENAAMAEQSAAVSQQMTNNFHRLMGVFKNIKQSI